MSDYISKSELFKLFKDLADEHETNSISYKLLCEIIMKQPTLDEKEIIRKAFERVMQRLEKEIMKWNDSYDLNRDNLFRSKYASGRCDEVLAIKEILKEECGISE